jgi:hypothetical protein
MLSEANYQKLTHQQTHLYPAIQQWRSQLDVDSGLTETELNATRQASQGRDFSW